MRVMRSLLTVTIQRIHCIYISWLLNLNFSLNVAVYLYRILGRKFQRLLRTRHSRLIEDCHKDKSYCTVRINKLYLFKTIFLNSLLFSLSRQFLQNIVDYYISQREKKKRTAYITNPQKLQINSILFTSC